MIFASSKETLVKTKTDLFNQKSDFGKKPNWVEPLKDWVKTLHHAGKLANSPDDFFEIKSLFEKIGSKRLLLDKKIEFDFVPAYAIANKHKALQAKQTKSPANAGPLSNGVHQVNPAWRRKRKCTALNLFQSKTIGNLMV